MVDLAEVVWKYAELRDRSGPSSAYRKAIELTNIARAHGFDPEGKHMAAAAYRELVRLRPVVKDGPQVDPFAGIFALYGITGPDINHDPIPNHALHDQYNILVKYFVSQGLDPNWKSKQGIPLLATMLATIPRKAEFLLELGRDQYLKGKGLATAWDILFHGQKWEPKSGQAAMSYLLQRGADIKYRWENGTTILIYLAQHSSGPLDRWAELLVAHGAELHAKDSQGRNALHHAAISGWYGEIPDQLLQLGIGVDEQDDQGHTALFYAAQSGNFQTISALLDWGADSSLLDPSTKERSFIERIIAQRAVGRDE